MTVCTYSVFNRKFFNPSLSENLTFITTTTVTSTLDNFNEFFSFGVHFFIFKKSICFAFMFTPSTPCLCHLTLENPIENLNSQEEQKARNF